MRAAAVQLTATADTDRNLEAADRLVRRAAGLGAELVVLPEKWAGIGPPEVVRELAQPLDGPALTWARDVARELGIDLVAGSVAEAGTPRGANTSVHVGPDGADRATYRKVHLFDVEVDETTYAESDAEDPGDHLVVSTLADGARIGMAVCYDLRFPEQFQALAAAGAQLLVLPSAFTLATTRDHWEVLVRARAIECQCFVVAANQVGEHAPGLRSGGRSLVVDPWGVVLAQAPDAEGVVVAELDLAAQDAVRRRLPSLTHRRPAVYAQEVVRS